MPDETEVNSEQEQENLIQLVVNLPFFGRRAQAQKAAARVRDVLRVALHNNDLKVEILGINPKRPWEGDPITGSNPE